MAAILSQPQCVKQNTVDNKYVGSTFSIGTVCFLPLGRCVETHFTNSLWAHDQIFWELFVMYFLLWRFSPGTDLHMSQQLSVVDYKKNCGLIWLLFFNITATHIFAKFVLWVYESFVRWVPSCCRADVGEHDDGILVKQLLHHSSFFRETTGQVSCKVWPWWFLCMR